MVEMIPIISKSRKLSKTPKAHFMLLHISMMESSDSDALEKSRELQK